MRQNYKRLLAALVLMSATQTSSVVQAEGIRLVGPSGEVQSSPSYAEEIERASPLPSKNMQPSRFFGPTGQKQTLWSIASELRPSDGVSVQQTLLSIYRLNPQAFENQNIHQLITGSRLRVPSLEQVQSVTTEQAVAIMKAHEDKLKQTKLADNSAPVLQAKEQATPTIKAKPEPVSPQPKTVTSVQNPEPNPSVNTSPQDEMQIAALKDKLQGSRSELESLEEKNHRLRLMLSEVQSEVETLKNELNDEERIRSEVERLLAEERQRLAEQQRMQPSMIDNILSNGWLVALLALIPGALLALLAVIALGRRAKQKNEELSEQQSQVTNADSLVVPTALTTADELEEELILDDSLFADVEAEIPTESEQSTQEDVFANLDSEDFDFNLAGDDDPFASIGDNGELDVNGQELESSHNGIQVNSEEKALGLEEMKRALDAVAPELEVIENNTQDYDLASEVDDSSDMLSDDAFTELFAADEPSEALPSEKVDQAMLDDLFAEFNNEDFALNTPASDFRGAQEGQAEPSNSSEEAVLDANSIDLLDELIEFEEDDTDDLFDPLNELQALSDFESDDSITELDANSTDLLDELLNDDLASELDEQTEPDPFDDLIREDENAELAKSAEEDDLLASFDFDEYQSQELNASTLAEEQAQRDSEFASGLDIDTLLNTNQPETSQATIEPLPAETVQTELSAGDVLQDDSEVIFSENDSLTGEHDDLVEAVAEEHQPTQKEDPDFVAELEALYQAEKGSLVEGNESPDEVSLVTPTPTPNTVENEFGIPQEEDWLLDEPESSTMETKSDHELALDQRELPEVSEENALTSMVDEAASNEHASTRPEPSEMKVANKTEDEFDFDDGELPEFSEEDALASMADEPISDEHTSMRPEHSEIEVANETEDEFDFDDGELPEFSEEDVLASMTDDPVSNESVSTQPEHSEIGIANTTEDKFDFEDGALPEFSEEDALASMAEEPELTSAEMADLNPILDENEDVSFDDHELPEFNEEDVMAAMTDGVPATPLHAEETVKPILHADNDHDALFDVFAQQNDFDIASNEDTVTPEVRTHHFDNESELSTLLEEGESSTAYEGKLDSDTVASAGMDFKSMLDVGEDWAGFTPDAEQVTSETDNDIPDDQREVWSAGESLNQPEIAQENWAEQSDFNDSDGKKNQFMTIDELMAQVDKEGGEFEEEDLKLDVGLNEFPDVIGETDDVDVDSNAEAAGNLDLAKIYLEMNDPEVAIKLLEEAIVYGEDEIRREAKKLIDTINGR